MKKNKEQKQPTDNGLTDKQKEFLQVFCSPKVLGNITVAARATGIRRETYYLWLKNPVFATAAKEARECRKDFIESALDKRIQAGDTAAIIFALKTVCKDRGYVERSEVLADTNIHAEVQTLDGLPKDVLLKIAEIIEPY